MYLLQQYVHGAVTPHLLCWSTHLTWLWCVTTTGDGQVAVLNGLLRACGRQGYGAALNAFSYWCVGLPLGYWLAFRKDLGVLGLWMAPAVSTALQAVVLHVLVGCVLSWEAESARAVASMGVNAGSNGCVVGVDHHSNVQQSQDTSAEVGACQSSVSGDQHHETSLSCSQVGCDAGTPVDQDIGAGNVGGPSLKGHAGQLLQPLLPK